MGNYTKAYEPDLPRTAMMALTRPIDCFRELNVTGLGEMKRVMLARYAGVPVDCSWLADWNRSSYSFPLAFKAMAGCGAKEATYHASSVGTFRATMRPPLESYVIDAT